MHLYFHIPFCTSKCPYCAFGSSADAFGLVAAYFDALKFEFGEFLRGLDGGFAGGASAGANGASGFVGEMSGEIAAAGERLARGAEKIETIFFGGGTPSAVAAHFYEPLFVKFSPFLAAGCEITFEANPRSASLAWLREIRALGATRVSFGVQSLRREKLRLLGRTHNPADALAALENAADAGFERINADFIYGTALDTAASLRGELRGLLAAPLSHASAYSLTIEDGTPFARTPHFARDDERLARVVFDEICSRGFWQYEISNFAAPRGDLAQNSCGLGGNWARKLAQNSQNLTKNVRNLARKSAQNSAISLARNARDFDLCRHNLAYWQGADYAGFGAFSVGTLGGVRFAAPSSIAGYIAAPLARSREPLTAQNLRDERVFLGLRSAVGVAADVLLPAQLARAQMLVGEGVLRAEFSPAPDETAPAQIAQNPQTALAQTAQSNHVRFFNNDYLLSDEIWLFLNSGE